MSDMLDMFRKYNCDKGDSVQNPHYYHLEYEPEMEKKRNDPIKILEIGIWHGTSFNAWHEYFPNAEIYGIDIFSRLQPSDVPALSLDRVHYLKGDSTNAAITKQIADAWGADIKFDFIIDDGLHTPDANRLTFNNIVPYLANDGVFYIEDAWPLHIMTMKEMEHNWIKSRSDSYNVFKMNMFLNALDNYNVEEVDLRKPSGLPDSYIFKVTK